MYTYLILCLLNWNLLNIHYIPFIGTTIVLTSTHPAHHKHEEKKHVFRFFVCEFEGGVWIFWKYPTYLFSGRRKITYSIILPRGLKTFFSNPICCFENFPCKKHRMMKVNVWFCFGPRGWWWSYHIIISHVWMFKFIMLGWLSFHSWWRYIPFYMYSIYSLFTRERRSTTWRTTKKVPSNYSEHIAQHLVVPPSTSIDEQLSFMLL